MTNTMIPFLWGSKRQCIEILLSRRGSTQGGTNRELVVNEDKFDHREDEKLLDMIVMGVHHGMNKCYEII